MNPFKAIANAKKSINDLKYQYSKTNSIKTAEQINTFIDVVETLEDFITNKYKIDVVDSLLYRRFATEIKNNILKEERINIKFIINEIAKDINYSSEYNLLELDRMLKGHERNLIINEARFEDLAKVKSYKKLIKKTVTELKYKILWRK